MKPSLAVLPDYLEERWPSMDLVAAQIVTAASQQADRWNVTNLRPAFKRRFSARDSAEGKSFTADRLLNRFWHYPRHVRALAWEHDVFHLADHSYSQLLHQLPAHRTVISLHDLDTFTPLLSPMSEPRGALFQCMTRHIWSGLMKAGHIACDSRIVRNQLLAAAPTMAARSSVVHNGVAEGFFQRPSDATWQAVHARLGSKPAKVVEILHVGSCIPRKRIDLLIRVFASVRAAGIAARLVRVGSKMTSSQRALAASLGVLGDVVECSDVPSEELIAIYHRAKLVLLTPDREGFGLPMIEALATGTSVVARDLPILREVGGPSPRYFSGEDISSGRDAVLSQLAPRSIETIAREKAERVEWARQFSWAVAAQRWAAIYEQLLAEPARAS